MMNVRAGNGAYLGLAALVVLSIVLRRFTDWSIIALIVTALVVAAGLWLLRRRSPDRDGGPRPP